MVGIFWTRGGGNGRRTDVCRVLLLNRDAYPGMRQSCLTRAGEQVADFLLPENSYLRGGWADLTIPQSFLFSPLQFASRINWRKWEIICLRFQFFTTNVDARRGARFQRIIKSDKKNISAPHYCIFQIDRNLIRFSNSQQTRTHTERIYIHVGVGHLVALHGNSRMENKRGEGRTAYTRVWRGWGMGKRRNVTEKSGVKYSDERGIIKTPPPLSHFNVFHARMCA